MGSRYRHLATATQVYLALRDRPRLKLDGHTTTSFRQPPAIKLSVLNVGKRATTVREIGVASQVPGKFVGT